MAISGTMTSADPVKFNRAKVGIDVGDAGTYVASETWITDIAVSGGEAPSQTDYTLGSIGFTSTGNPAEYTITMDIVYTEGDTDPFHNLYTEHTGEANERAVDIQWSKEGSTTGDPQYTTAGGRLVNVTLPNFSSGGNGKVMVQATIKAPWPIAKADIT